jgi:hypothetical protein
VDQDEVIEGEEVEVDIDEDQDEVIEVVLEDEVDEEEVEKEEVEDKKYLSILLKYFLVYLFLNFISNHFLKYGSLLEILIFQSSVFSKISNLYNLFFGIENIQSQFKVAEIYFDVIWGSNLNGFLFEISFGVNGFQVFTKIYKIVLLLSLNLLIMTL